MSNHSALLSVFMAAALTACGGGGGSDTTAPLAASNTTSTQQGANATPASTPTATPAAPPAGTTTGSASTPTQVASWRVTDLGTLGEYALIGGAVPGINNLGQLLAVSAPNPYVRSSVIYHNGTVTQITLPDRSVSAAAINDAGVAVGYTFIPGRPATEVYPFIYRNGQMSSFGNQGTQAIDINSTGQVTGNSSFAENSNTAFLYRDGAMTNLGTLGTGTRSWAMAINDNGQVVGSSLVNAGDFNTDHAFLYSNGKMTDLGTLGTGPTSQAVAINNKAQVVGVSRINSDPNDGTLHTFLYSAGTMTDLGPMRAWDINNHGEIVGSTGAGDAASAVLYREGKQIDLNGVPGVAGSGWKLNYARAINDSGQIVGTGTVNGELRGFLLSPVR